MENFLHVMTKVMGVAITLSFLDEQVRNMSFENLGNDQKSLR